MPIVAFVVHGQPGAQPRPRFRRHGNFVQTYEPKEATSYKAEIKRALASEEDLAWDPRLGPRPAPDNERNQPEPKTGEAAA